MRKANELSKKEFAQYKLKSDKEVADIKDYHKVISEEKDNKIRENIQSGHKRNFFKTIIEKNYWGYTETTDEIRRNISEKIEVKIPSVEKFLNRITIFESIDDIFLKLLKELNMKHLHKYFLE